MASSFVCPEVTIQKLTKLKAPLTCLLSTAAQFQDQSAKPSPKPHYGFSVFPVPTPLCLFRQEIIYVCMLKVLERSSSLWVLSGPGWPLTLGKAPRSSHEAEGGDGKQSLLVLFKGAGLCCCSGQIRHIKCPQSALSTWLTSKVVCQRGHREEGYTTTYKLCRCAWDSLKGWWDPGCPLSQKNMGRPSDDWELSSWLPFFFLLQNT